MKKMQQIYRLAGEGVRNFVEQAYVMPLLTREETDELIRKWQTSGDIKARNMVVNCNIRYVLNYISCMYQISADVLNSRVIEDIIQDGVNGVIEAINHYDPDKKVVFQTYAARWIKKYVSISFENNMKNDAVSIHYKRFCEKSKKISDAYYSEHGKRLSEKEALKLAGAPPKTIESISHVRNISFCELTPAVYDAVVDDSFFTEDAAIVNISISHMKEMLYQELKEKDFQVVAYMMGYEDGIIHTSSDAVSYFGISRQMVSKILKHVRQLLIESGVIGQIYRENGINPTEKVQKMLENEADTEAELTKLIGEEYAKIKPVREMEQSLEIYQQESLVADHAALKNDIQESLAADHAVLSNTPEAMASNLESFAKDFFDKKKKQNNR